MTRQQAEKMRQQAQKLLDNASPQEREMLEDLAREMAAKNAENKNNPRPPSDPADLNPPSQPQPQQSEKPSSQGPQSNPQPSKPDPSRSQPKSQPDPAGSPAPDNTNPPTIDDRGTDPNPAKPTGTSTPINTPGPGSNADLPPSPGLHDAQQSAPSANGDDGPPTGPGGRQPRRNPRGPIAGPSEASTVPVDARSTPAIGADEHVISDYLNPNQQPRRTGSAAGPTLQEGLREAASGAERAIEQQGVPSQYSDLVRRVFKRYIDRAQPPAAAPATAMPPPPPTVDAQDARPAARKP